MPHSEQRKRRRDDDSEEDSMDERQRRAKVMLLPDCIQCVTLTQGNLIEQSLRDDYADDGAGGNNHSKKV